MKFVPNIYDYAIVAFVVVAAVVEILLMPVIRKRRVVAYAYMSVYLWFTAIVIIVLWSVESRSWNALLLGETVWWRLAIGFAIAAAYVAFMSWQHGKMLKPKHRPAIARAMAPVAWMMPRTGSDRIWCVALSVAAGVCEEIMFRGFGLTFFAFFVGVPAAIVISALAFGLGHAYQDRRAIVTTGGFGLAMTAVVLVSGSLLPAIAIHIFQDLIMTDVGYHVFTANAEAA
jgi:membrane protease YdiL (CAAX protease family)